MTAASSTARAYQRKQGFTPGGGGFVVCQAAEIDARHVFNFSAGSGDAGACAGSAEVDAEIHD
jgi:hypothetical protein